MGLLDRLRPTFNGQPLDKRLGAEIGEGYDLVGRKLDEEAKADILEKLTKALVISQQEAVDQLLMGKVIPPTGEALKTSLADAIKHVEAGAAVLHPRDVQQAMLMVSTAGGGKVTMSPGPSAGTTAVKLSQTFGMRPRTGIQMPGKPMRQVITMAPYDPLSTLIPDFERDQRVLVEGIGVTLVAMYGFMFEQVPEGTMLPESMREELLAHERAGRVIVSETDIPAQKRLYKVYEVTP